MPPSEDESELVEIKTELLTLLYVNDAAATFTDKTEEGDVVEVSYNITKSEWVSMGRPSSLRVTAEVFRG